MHEAGRGLWLGKWQDRSEESWGREACAKAAGFFLEAFGLSLEGITCPHPRPRQQMLRHPWCLSSDTPTRTHGQVGVLYRLRCVCLSGHKTEDSQLPKAQARLDVHFPDD